MTVAYLMKNTVLAATRAWQHTALACWDLKYLPLKPLERVPSDIEVARAQIPKDVSTLAEEIGLSYSELDLYGKKKAKVDLKVLERLQERKNGKQNILQILGLSIVAKLSLDGLCNH